MAKRNFQYILIFLVLLLVWLFYLGYKIVSFSFINGVKPSDVAIVLGASVWGNRPSPVFRERIRHVIKLYKRGIIKKIIFTGGTGDNKKFAESEVARLYAIKRGVKQKDILIETVSKTTIENLRQAKIIIRSHLFKTALLVSDPLHMKRSVSIARDMGLEVRSSPTTTSRYKSFSSQALFLFREIYFYQRYLLFGF